MQYFFLQTLISGYSHYKSTYNENWRVESCVRAGIDGMPDRQNLGASRSTVHFLSSSTLSVNGFDQKRSVVKICGFMAEL